MLIRGPRRGASRYGACRLVRARADDEVGELRAAATEAFEALADEDP
jgi:hypothetical protein